MKKKKKGIIIGLSVLIVLGVGGFFAFKTFFSKPGSKSVMQAQVNTVSLEKMDLTESVSATGTIESADTETVSADVQNVAIKKVLVKVGDTVKKGQNLVTFDKSDLKEALTEATEDYSDTVSQASTELSNAYQQLSEAKSDYASEKKKLDKEVKKAKQALEKAKKTKDAKAIEEAKDTKTIEEAKSALDKAKENRTSMNKQNLKAITQAKQSVRQAQTNNKKQLRQGKRSVQDAKKTLKSATMKATMDGTVTALGVSAGDQYNGADAVEISDLENMQVSTTVSEYDINKVKEGQRVVILTDATGDEEIEGEITYVAMTMGTTTLSSNSQNSSGMSEGMGSSGSSSSDSGYEVVISISGKNEKLRAGMTAKCSIIINEVEDVYAVPYDAIHTNNNSEDVIYVKDSSGTKKEVVVTKGMESDYYAEVSSSELSDGMSIIIPSDDISTDTSKSDDSSGDGFGFMMGGGNSGPPSGGFPGGSGNGDSPSGGFPGGK